MTLKSKEISTKKIITVIGAIVAVAAAVTGIVLFVTKLLKKKHPETEYIECDGMCSECDEDCDAKLYIDDSDEDDNAPEVALVDDGAEE